MEHDEWFDDSKKNPLDSMPIATNKYHPDDDYAPCEYEPPMTDSDWFIKKPNDTYSSRHKSTPDHEKGAEEVVTMHEKMYRMATQNHSPWKEGGSENFQGGSENVR